MPRRDNEHRVRGGILLRVAGRLRPVAVALHDAPCPHCWRCHRQLSFDAVEFAPSDDESFPWVAVCRGCLSDDDRAAREADA